MAARPEKTIPAAVPPLTMPLAFGRPSSSNRCATAEASGGDVRPVLTPARVIAVPSTHLFGESATSAMPIVAADPAIISIAREPSLSPTRKANMMPRQ